MTADILVPGPRKTRPSGVAVLATLAGIGAFLGVLAIIAGGGLMAIALTLLGGMTAYGLWNMRPWGWPLALVTWVIGTIQAVLLLTESTLNTNLVVGPLAIVYLMQSDIRAVFARDD